MNYKRALVLSMSLASWCVFAQTPARTLVVSLGGYPDFLYSVPYSDQIKNVLSDVLKPMSVQVEYHPWATIPKFVQQFNHGTVVPVGSTDLPKGFIASTPFSTANSHNVSLILKDTVDNQGLISSFNSSLRAKQK